VESKEVGESDTKINRREKLEVTEEDARELIERSSFDNDGDFNIV
jgi:hypothetical protein